MTTEVVDVGDLRRFTIDLTDVNGEPADPTDLVLSVLRPDGTTAQYAYAGSPQDVVRSVLGSFYCDVRIEQSGRHYCRWVASGTLVTSEQFEFWARYRQV